MNKLLLKHWGIKLAEQDDLNQALETSCRKLQQSHLDYLSNSNAQQIVLISDTCFHFYKKNVSEWQAEPALYLDYPNELPGYVCNQKHSWLWHIAPQDIEQKNYGAIHEVHAWALKRKREKGDVTHFPSGNG